MQVSSAGDLRDTGSIPVWEDALEEETTTHSSILASRISWTEEPGQLLSLGSERKQLSTQAQTKRELESASLV